MQNSLICNRSHKITASIRKFPLRLVLAAFRVFSVFRVTRISCLFRVYWTWFHACCWQNY